jgi:hypothetical protein
MTDKPWWWVFLIVGALFYQYPISRFFEWKFRKFVEDEDDDEEEEKTE